jgi:uncharacterized protein YndB with AHSA1/START domain
MSEQPTTVKAIRKTVTVARPREEAFRVFAERLADWWPRKYLLGQDRAERAVLEPREGGRVYEVQAGGHEAEWGRVLAYDPPERLVLAWGLNGSEVEIRFADEGAGTRVNLEHRGWDRLEDRQEREAYDAGWEEILAEYVRVARAEA